MTELEKLRAGIEYDFWDKAVESLKLHAIRGCEKLNGIPVTETQQRDQMIRELLGEAGENAAIMPAFTVTTEKISESEKIFSPIIM